MFKWSDTEYVKYLKIDVNIFYDGIRNKEDIIRKNNFQIERLSYSKKLLTNKVFVASVLKEKLRQSTDTEWDPGD